MNNVFFNPWEGKNYSGATPKCLVVGESHYAKQEVSPNFTRDLIREHSQGVWHHKYFTTWIPHPSYYFSAPMWSPWVKSLLERGLTN